MKKLFIMIAPLLLISCSELQQISKSQQTPQEQIIAECEGKLTNKEYQKESEMHEKCLKPKIITSLTTNGSHDIDLAKKGLDGNIELLKQKEAGKITEEQMTKLSIKLSNEIIVETNKRALKRQTKLQKYYRDNPEVLIQQQQLQLQQQQLAATQQQTKAIKDAAFSQALGNLANQINPPTPAVVYAPQPSQQPVYNIYPQPAYRPTNTFLPYLPSNR
jgi:hypothetical protein